ncbi:MAG: Anaerobic sulfite reductase subunit A [Desulfovibrio sp.]
MPGTKFIAQADVSAWLAELASSMRVVAPRAEGNAVVYRDYDAEKGIELSKKPTESAKHVLFPRSEELFSFGYKRPVFAVPEKGKEDEPLPETAPAFEVFQPDEPKPTVVFGMLGCDAGTVTTFDPIYNGAKFKDVYYLKKRDAAILIVRACADVLTTCFCTWVGGDPADRRNGDILATEIDGGWLLEPLTERAERVMGSALLKDAGKDQPEKAESVHKTAREAMGDAPKLDGIDNALFALFDDGDFWQAESAGCLACGACTYLCPTCHCFSITDETAGRNGVRLRSWDTCMASLYTMEASGHNPRTQKAARLKNRVGHKFAYFLRNNDGQISCCGCGRCIRSCPSSVDIRRIVKDALAKGGTIKEKANG